MIDDPKYTFETELARYEAMAARLQYEQAQRMVDQQLDGRYSFSRDITQKSCNKLLRAMQVWHDHNPRGDWVITLNSVGGDLIAGISLLDELYHHSIRGGGSHHITIRVRGLAASMAAMLLQAADLRLVGKSSQVMVHESRGTFEGTFSQLSDEVKYHSRVHALIIDLFMQRARNITYEVLEQRISRRDWYISAEECIHYGIADDIG